MNSYDYGNKNTRNVSQSLSFSLKSHVYFDSVQGDSIPTFVVVVKSKEICGQIQRNDTSYGLIREVRTEVWYYGKFGKRDYLVVGPTGPQSILFTLDGRETSSSCWVLKDLENMVMWVSSLHSKPACLVLYSSSTHTLDLIPWEFLFLTLPEEKQYHVLVSITSSIICNNEH